MARDYYEILGVGKSATVQEINHRANIFAMKKIGVTHILSVSAVGSLKEELSPKDVVLIDQYYDRTRQGAKHTFFGEGIVGHIPFSDPICNEFKNFVYDIAGNAILDVYHKKEHKAVKNGTYVNMEGPAFSTKAESNAYRQFGFDVIGMTSIGEAKLAREAGICYCVTAMVTDYDCWHPDHDNVSVEMVVNTMKSNIKVAKIIIEKLAESFSQLERNCNCVNALQYSIMTEASQIAEAKKDELKPIISKYI